MPGQLSVSEHLKLSRHGFALVAQTVVVVLCALALAGCSVNVASIKAQSQNDWDIHPQPQPPENEVEQAVVVAAQTRRDVPVESSDCVYIFEDRVAQYVDVVERTSDADPFVPRGVTRYRVVGDKIAAHTETSMEVFPSVDFERTALRSASMAGGTDSVILYDSDVCPSVLASRRLGRCAAEVRIFKKDESGGTPVAKKIINLCYR